MTRMAFLHLISAILIYFSTNITLQSQMKRGNPFDGLFKKENISNHNSNNRENIDRCNPKQILLKEYSLLENNKLRDYTSKYKLIITKKSKNLRLFLRLYNEVEFHKYEYYFKIGNKYYQFTKNPKQHELAFELRNNNKNNIFGSILEKNKVLKIDLFTKVKKNGCRPIPIKWKNKKNNVVITLKLEIKNTNNKLYDLAKKDITEMLHRGHRKFGNKNIILGKKKANKLMKSMITPDTFNVIKKMNEIGYSLNIKKRVDSPKKSDLLGYISHNKRIVDIKESRIEFTTPMHELGHANDFIHNYISNTNTFKSAYNKDLNSKNKYKAAKKSKKYIRNPQKSDCDFHKQYWETSRFKGYACGFAWKYWGNENKIHYYKRVCQNIKNYFNKYGNKKPN